MLLCPALQGFIFCASVQCYTIPLIKIVNTAVASIILFLCGTISCIGKNLSSMEALILSSVQRREKVRVNECIIQGF